MPSRDVASEIEALHRELASAPSAASADGAGPKQDVDEADPFGPILKDLQQRFTEAVDETEHLVAEHPAASLAAAFVVGVLVRRILGATR